MAVPSDSGQNIDRSGRNRPVNRYTQRRGGWTSGTKGHRQLGFPGKQ